MYYITDMRIYTDAGNKCCRSKYIVFPISLLSYEREEMNTQICKDGHEKRDALIYRNI